MKYLIELPVGAADGRPPQTVAVEIDQAEDGLIDVARPGQVAARAARSLGEMLAGIRPVAESFVEHFEGMTPAPDEIALEFGLSLSAQADIIISSTAAQANFKVALTWRNTTSAATVADPAAAGGQEP